MGNRTKKRKSKNRRERKRERKDERKWRKKEKGRAERAGKKRTSENVQDKDTGIGTGNKEKIFIVFSLRPPTFFVHAFALFFCACNGKDHRTKNVPARNILRAWTGNMRRPASFAGRRMYEWFY